MAVQLKWNALILMALSVLAGSCRRVGDDFVVGGQGGSRLSSVSMSIPDQLKPMIASGKIDAWQLSAIGSDCPDGRSAVSIKDKFGMFSGSGLMLSEKITSGCAYTFALSLGKANVDKSKLETVYLTNDLDGQRTIVSKEKTKDPKVQVNITVFYTPEGQKDLGGSVGTSPDPAQPQTPSPIPTPTPNPTPNPTPTPNNSGTNPGTTPAPTDTADCYKGSERICKIEKLIAEKTNQYRQSSGRSDLGYDAKVAFVSRDWSAKQARMGDIGHDGFPAARQAVYRQEFKTGVNLSGENVAYSSCSPSQSEEQIATMFARMWWNSAGHRANMLGRFSFIGVGVFIDSRGRCYGTQIFR